MNDESKQIKRAILAGESTRSGEEYVREQIIAAAPDKEARTLADQALAAVKAHEQAAWWIERRGESLIDLMKDEARLILANQ